LTDVTRYRTWAHLSGYSEYPTEGLTLILLRIFREPRYA